MFKKRILFKIIVLILILLTPFSNNIYADDEDEEEININQIQEIVETVSQPISEPSINAKAAIIYDRKSKRIIFR